jgi:hypothetical protein
MRTLDGLDDFFRNVFAVLFESVRAHGKSFPLELHACGFENADCGLCDLWADAIAGN